MRILLIGLDRLGFANEKFAPNLNSALLLLEKGFKFDIVIYRNSLDDCDCCCEITKNLRKYHSGVLITVIDAKPECCNQARKAGADNYLSIKDYDKYHVGKIIHLEKSKNKFKQTLQDYKSIYSAVPALI